MTPPNITVSVFNEEPDGIQVYVEESSKERCGTVIKDGEEVPEPEVKEDEGEILLDNPCGDSNISITVSKGEECVDWWTEACFVPDLTPEVNEKASAKPKIKIVNVNNSAIYDIVPEDISTPETSQFNYYDIGKVLVGEDDFVVMEIDDYLNLKAQGWRWFFGRASTTPLWNTDGLGGGDVVVFTDTNPEGEPTGTFTFNQTTGQIIWYIGHDNNKNETFYFRLNALDPRPNYVLSDYDFIFIKTMLDSRRPILDQWSNQNMGHLENTEIKIMNYNKTTEYTEVDLDLRFTIPTKVSLILDKEKGLYNFVNPIIINNNAINEAVYIYAKDKYRQKTRSTGFQIKVEQLEAQPDGYITVVFVSATHTETGRRFTKHTMECGLVGDVGLDCDTNEVNDPNNIGFPYDYYFPDVYDKGDYQGEKELFWRHETKLLITDEDQGGRLENFSYTITYGIVLDPKFQLMAIGKYSSKRLNANTYFDGYEFFSTYDNRAYPYSVVVDDSQHQNVTYGLDYLAPDWIIVPKGEHRTDICEGHKCVRIYW